MNSNLPAKKISHTVVMDYATVTMYQSYQSSDWFCVMINSIMVQDRVKCYPVDLAKEDYDITPLHSKLDLIYMVLEVLTQWCFQIGSA